LAASQTMAFSAAVTGLTNQTVTWSLIPANTGTITSTGAGSAQYQAPASIAVQQTVQVVATASNGTTTGSATVTLRPIVPGTAVFLKSDSVTQGNWKGVYGSNGYNIVGDTFNYPAYVTVTPVANLAFWTGSTSDVRALQQAASPTGRIAGAWYYNPGFTIDLNFNDQAAHQVAIYCMDWDSTTRAQTVTVMDANTNAVLDTRNMSGFNGGQYLVWNLSGHVILKVTWTAGSNALVNGLFFE